MDRWSTRIAAALLLVSMAGAAAAQVALHHSFPVAGRTLTLVVTGVEPQTEVYLQLDDVLSAPPSLRDFFVQTETFRVDGEALVAALLSDASGRVRIDVELDDAGDVGAPIALTASSLTRPNEATRVDLTVIPPVVVVASGAGYERVSLLTGERLLPPIPGNGELKGVAVSADGMESYALYENGRLETWAGQGWTPAPSDVAFLDPSSEGLATVPQGGVAFVLVRSAARPFAPAGELLFPSDGFAPLVLEPMGDAVDGRRWAVSDDGLTAFVAEDYLTVRQVDLLHREPGTMFTAGRGGDFSIADLALDGERLYVVTRSVDGRPGSLTTYHLRSGVADVVGLTSDPREMIVLDGGVSLIVTTTGSQMDVVIDGVVAASVQARGGQWLDASAVSGGALMLRREVDGRHTLHRYDIVSGSISLIAEGLPPVTRVITQGEVQGGHALLLGDPSGQLWSFDLVNGAVAPVADVLIDPAAAVVQIP